jgi:glutathione peroxidase
MSRRFLLHLLVVLGLSIVPAVAQAPAAHETVYDFSLVGLDGKEVPLSTYKGKVLLIVNLASQSVYNDQIAALNALARDYGPQGLVILGIPSEDFGGEELKDAAAVRSYYTTTAHVDFPVFATAKLHGVEAIPLYAFLCDPKVGLPGGDIHWNYTKFLVDRQGKPLARFEVGQDPADDDFRVTIEKALAGKLKKQGKEKDSGSSSSDDDDDDEG